MKALLCRALAQAVCALARVTEALGFIRLAESALRRAARFVPEHNGVLYYHGRALMTAGRLDEAADVFREITGKNPGFAGGHNDYGWILQQLGRHDDALQVIDRALAIEPSNSELHLARGISLYNLGRFQEAAESYERARRHDPGNALAHANLGVVLANQGEWPAAVACHERAYELSHNSVDAMNLADALAQQERFPEAVSILRAAIKNDPSLAELQIRLSTLLVEVGSVDEAIKMLRVALKRDPTNRVAASTLAAALVVGGDGEHALSVAEELLSNHKGAASYATHGWVHFKLGNTEEALKDFDEAIRLDPHNADYLARRAATLTALQRYREALTAFEEAAQRNPRLFSTDRDLNSHYAIAQHACSAGGPPG